MTTRGTAGARVVVVTAVVGLVAVLGGAWNTTRAHGSGDSRRTIKIPLATAGLIPGEGLRTTITNYGTRPVTVEALVIDADGAVVKQETVAIAPNQSRSVEMSRAEVARSEQSVVVRTEIVARRADLEDVDVTTEVIDWSTGGTRFLAGRRGCVGPTSMCGSDTNHNETIVRDGKATEESQRWSPYETHE